MLVHGVAGLLVLWSGLIGWFDLPVIAALLGITTLLARRACRTPRQLAEMLAELTSGGRGYRFFTVAVVLLFVGAFAIVVLNQLRYTVQDADRTEIACGVPRLLRFSRTRILHFLSLEHYIM